MSGSGILQQCGSFDVTIESSNARDLVIHSGPAISPPNDVETGDWQFYLHPHQQDNLLAASGGRTFYLVNLAWEQPFHIVRLAAGRRHPSYSSWNISSIHF
jgi:hypothetical protein